MRKRMWLWLYLVHGIWMPNLFIILTPDILKIKEVWNLSDWPWSLIFRLMKAPERRKWVPSLVLWIPKREIMLCRVMVRLKIMMIFRRKRWEVWWIWMISLVLWFPQLGSEWRSESCRIEGGVVERLWRVVLMKGVPENLWGIRSVVPCAEHNFRQIRMCKKWIIV